MAAVPETFHVGKKFTTFRELINCKEIYEKCNFVNLAFVDAKRFEQKHAPNRVARANKELRYYFLRLCCSHGGRKFKKQGHGKRETK